MNYERAPASSRFAFLALLSIILIVTDHRTNILDQVRIVASIVNLPFEAIVSLPHAITETIERFYPDSDLQDRYRLLQQKQTVLESRLQRYETVLKENRRLMDLLSASQKSSDEFTLAKIINFRTEAFTHRAVINIGVESGVYVGQPAISPQGVVGQIVETGYRRSVLILISDITHGLPVEVERNGLRTIVQGSGKTGLVKLPYLGRQANIRTGDRLVTSGISGRFPAGYKVAIVTDIIQDANEAFMNITAETTAQINHVREVALLWNTATEEDPLLEDAGTDSR